MPRPRQAPGSPQAAAPAPPVHVRPRVAGSPALLARVPRLVPSPSGARAPCRPVRPAHASQLTWSRVKPRPHSREAGAGGLGAAGRGLGLHHVVAARRRGAGEDRDWEEGVVGGSAGRGCSLRFQTTGGVPPAAALPRGAQLRAHSWAERMPLGEGLTPQIHFVLPPAVAPSFPPSDPRSLSPLFSPSFPISSFLIHSLLSFTPSFSPRSLLRSLSL